MKFPRILFWLPVISLSAGAQVLVAQSARWDGMAGNVFLTEGLPVPPPNAQSTPVPSGTVALIREARWDFTLLLENGTVLRLSGVARPWLPVQPEEDRWKESYFPLWGKLQGTRVKVLCGKVVTDGENRQAAWVKREDGGEALNLWAIREGLGVVEDDPNLTQPQRESLWKAQEDAQIKKKGCWKFTVKDQKPTPRK